MAIGCTKGRLRSLDNRRRKCTQGRSDVQESRAHHHARPQWETHLMPPDLTLKRDIKRLRIGRVYHDTMRVCTPPVM